MRSIGILVYPDFQILDASGPASVFEMASRFVPGAYEVALLSASGGQITSSGAMAVASAVFTSATPLHTLIVAGGEGVISMSRDESFLGTLQTVAANTQRVASVCSGAYVLAAAGLLDGRRATTHWRRTPDFLRRFPRVRLDMDRIYVHDGRFWTSAGISAGIDLALALVADDLGEEMAQRIARQLVVYYRRPGGQSQHAALLELTRPESAFGRMLATVRENLTQTWTVEKMAELSHLSPRQFARRFKSEVGLTPAKAVTQLRVEAAQAMLTGPCGRIDVIARACGFTQPENMRRAFIQLTGRPPSAFRTLE